MTIEVIQVCLHHKTWAVFQGRIRNRLLSKKNPFKLIKAVMFDIENHEKEILSVGYTKKTIETKDKWNQINILDVQSL